MQPVLPPRTEIGRHELMAPADYERVRASRLDEAAGVERDRRLPIGPDAALAFECFATAWLRCHERLRAGGRAPEGQVPETWGDAEVAAALEEANAAVPRGQELVARLRVEDGAPAGVEGTLSLRFAGEVVPGTPGPNGFLRFPLTPAQAERFRQPQVQVLAASEHPGYAHLVAMPEATRRALASDLA
jgi:hypothetical protein